MKLFDIKFNKTFFKDFNEWIGGWKTRLGFYIILANLIFSTFGYYTSIRAYILGFAFMLLGIGHKLEKK